MTILERARKYSSRHCNGCYISCSSGDCERPKIENIWLNGFAEGRKVVCEEILIKLRTDEGLEPFFKNYIYKLIKSLGVEV